LLDGADEPGPHVTARSHAERCPRRRLIHIQTLYRTLWGVLKPPPGAAPKEPAQDPAKFLVSSPQYAYTFGLSPSPKPQGAPYKSSYKRITHVHRPPCPGTTNF